MKTTQLPSIYEYNDFRKFIADFQQAKFAHDETYTKSYMSKLLGIPRSRSYMTDIFNGKQVSETFTERFIRLFDFNRDEARFFRALVNFNQSDNPDKRELCFEQLIGLNKTPKKYLYEQSYMYYKDWYNAAIRAILNVYDFDGRDFSALAKKLASAITAPQAKRAIALLLKLKLIAKNDKGFYKPTTSSISTEDYVRDELVKQFQVKCLDLAKQAIISNEDIPKHVSTNTISVSKVGQKIIEKQIHRFRSQIRSLVHKDENPAETVYQLDILFFPMMK